MVRNELVCRVQGRHHAPWHNMRVQKAQNNIALLVAGHGPQDARCGVRIRHGEGYSRALIAGQQAATELDQAPAKKSQFHLSLYEKKYV